jgi:pimeloyl-ACP methyl ester carboxylesterase
MYLGLRVRNELVRLGAAAVPFSDDELRSLRVPSLLLIGEEEVLYDPVRALSRARQLIPGLVGELIPGASHDLVFRQPEIVDERLLAFLAAVEESRPPPVGDETVAQHA